MSPVEGRFTMDRRLMAVGSMSLVALGVIVHAAREEINYPGGIGRPAGVPASLGGARAGGPRGYGSRSPAARRACSVTRREITMAKYSTPIICWIITSERAWSLAGVISPNPTLVRQVKLK